MVWQHCDLKTVMSRRIDRKDEGRNRMGSVEDVGFSGAVPTRPSAGRTRASGSRNARDSFHEQLVPSTDTRLWPVPEGESRRRRNVTRVVTLSISVLWSTSATETDGGPDCDLCSSSAY